VNSTQLRLLRAAAVAFLSSKALLLLMLLFGSQLAFLRKTYGNSVWETEITLSSSRLWPELQRMVMAGDSWWYARIAADGYDKTLATPTVAFFPVFPFTIRTLGPTGNFALDGVLVSAVALFVSLILLGQIGIRAGFAIEDVERAMFYLCFFPTAYFLSLPLTESLFLLLSLGSILSGMTGRWWAAGILAALATLTRVPGILLSLPLLLILLERRDRPRQAGWLLLIPAGLGLYLWRLHVWTGDAFAFAHVQAGWERHASWPVEPLFRYLSNPSAASRPWNFVTLHFAVAALLLVAGVAMTITRRPKWLGLYTLASIALPLSSGSLQSIARYALVVFPLFLWLGYQGRRPLVDKLILGTSATVLGWLVAWLVMRVDFALA
jgi:Gpi18-like mannosyltransferase